MKRLAVAAALVAVIFAAASPAEAAIRRWSIEAGLQGGYNKIDADADIENDVFYGGHLGLAIFPALTAEVFFDTLSSEDERPKVPADYTQDVIGLRLLGTFRSGEETKVMPYILAAFGQSKVSYERTDLGTTDDDKTTFEEVGGGVRYAAWKDLSIRGELAIRHFRTLDVTHADALLSVGVSWMFGGKK